ncbi:MAG TPA: hypothetical protein VIC60_01780 [Thermomicrobiales bacterium]
MESVAFALPILPGKTEAARTFQRLLNGSRKGEYGESERNIGITKELWFLQQTPNGDLFVAYLESPDAARALATFSQSRAVRYLVQGATRRHHGDGYEYSAPGPAQRVALVL